MISVIIPTYNRAVFLSKCLISILNQTYKDIEIIVLDDGSKDNTADVVTNFQDRRIIYINDGRINNIAKLRNKGIRMSKGDYIALCDDDDLWMENKIEIQLKYLLNEKIVCSNGNVINEFDKVIYRAVNNFDNDFYIGLSDLLIDDRVLTSSVLTTRRVLEECGLFDENLGNRSEDYALWLKIAQKHEIKYINKILISYRKHQNNLSLRSFSDTTELLFRNIDILSPFLQHGDSKIVLSANVGLATIYSKLTKLFYLNNDILNSFQYCKKLLAYYPLKKSIKYFKYVLIYNYIKLFKFIKTKL